MSVGEIAPIALGAGAILLTGGLAAPAVASAGAAGAAGSAGLFGLSAATTASLATGATLLGGAVSTFGAVSQGIAAKEAAEFQAEIAQRNADLEVIRQQQITDSADNERRRLSRNIAVARGQGRTSFAASGVDLGGGGAPLQWEIELDLQQQFDSNLITNNEQAQLFDSRIRQSSGSASASALRKSGRNQFTSGLISGGSSLLGSFSTAANNQVLFRRQGIPS